MLEVISGEDPLDSTCARVPVGGLRGGVRSRRLHGIRIGVPEEYFAEGLDPEVDASVQRCHRALESEAASLRPVKLPHTRYGVATYYVVATAEASSNLARFDGVRFGFRIERPGSDLNSHVRRDARRAASAPRSSAASCSARTCSRRGLLRRLLPKAQTGAHAHPTGLRRAFSRGRRDRRTDQPDPGVSSRREDRRSARDVPLATSTRCRRASRACAPYPCPARPRRRARIVRHCRWAPARCPGFCEERLFTVASAWECDLAGSDLKPPSRAPS